MKVAWYLLHSFTGAFCVWLKPPSNEWLMHKTDRIEPRDKAPSIFNPFIYPAFRNSLWQEHKWFCSFIIAKEKKAISKLREPYLMPGSCFFFRCTNRGSNQRFDQRICGICGNDCWKLWLVNWSGEAEVSFLSHRVYPKSLKSRQYLKIVFLLAT